MENTMPGEGMPSHRNIRARHQNRRRKNKYGHQQKTSTQRRCQSRTKSKPSRYDPTQDAIGTSTQHISAAKQSIEVLRTEFRTMDNSLKEVINNCLSVSMEGIKKINESLNSIVKSDDSETALVKQQIAKVFQEKVKLQQQIIHLSSKIENVESAVGYEKS